MNLEPVPEAIYLRHWLSALQVVVLTNTRGRGWQQFVQRALTPASSCPPTLWFRGH